MNWTTITADFLSRNIDQFDALQREIEKVSNNLGVCFLFCLFGLAILALFLCRSMRALQTNSFFFSLFNVAKFGKFLCINKFLQAGHSGFQVTAMIEWGQKSKPQKIPSLQGRRFLTLTSEVH